MEDESIRKMLEMSDAMAEAGRRLREPDLVSFRLAEEARNTLSVAAEHRKMMGIDDAMAEAGRRLRDSDSISYKSAQQALTTSRVAAEQRAMLGLGPAHSVMTAFAEQDRLARQVAIASVQPMASQSIVDVLQRSERFPGFAIGPLAEMRDAGVFAAQQRMMHDSLAVSARMLEKFEAGFRIPSSIEAARLVTQYDQSATARALSLVGEHGSLLSAMEQMRSPWLDMANPLRSGTSFAAIQQMADAVRVAPAFDVGIASALRLELGDWRQPIAWPKEIFSDLGARSSFYASLGVNPALTSMPAPAFRETLEIAGLIEPSISDDEVESEEGEAEDGFIRTNEAHEQLLRLEVGLRELIAATLFAEYGNDWMKRSVPAATLEQWKEKHGKGKRHTGGAVPLIAYADFTDYERIICRGDNWKHFERYFVRKESLLESFQRLYPIRLDTMHARLITQDDQLFLLVEYKRLMQALRIFSDEQSLIN